MGLSGLIKHLYIIIAALLTIVAVAAYRPNLDTGQSGQSPAMLNEDHESPEAVRSPRVISSVEVNLRWGSTLADALKEAGMTNSDSSEVAESLADVIDLRRLKVNQEIIVGFSKGELPIEVRVPVRFDRTAVAIRSESGWRSEDVLSEVIPVPVHKHAVIDSSLYAAAKDTGIPLSIMMEAIDLFSFEVDFQREIHPGDSVELFYEMLVDEDGRDLAAGELIYGRLNIGDREVEAWRYERLDGKVEYYETGGDSVRKALLKTPVDGARLSSGFGMRRHPILGYTALHRGIDFAVPTGTPVKASGDGVVLLAGWHDQYGYRVKIRHANHYDTMYAHLSTISPGIRSGVRIEQGTIVGKSGNTGMSTGPHCHYEVHYYGSPVDPSTLKFPPGHKLEEKDAELFALERRALLAGFEIGHTEP